MHGIAGQFCDPLWILAKKKIGSKYNEILLTREPTALSHPGRQIIKKLADGSILSEKGSKTASFYIKDRIQHCRNIRKDLLKKRIVLCSRYDLSTYAYQMNMGHDFQSIYNDHHYSEKNGALIPDLTVFFKINAHTALKRIQCRQNKSEAFEKYQFLHKAAQTYQAVIKLLKKTDNRNIAVIDAENPLEKVILDVKKQIELFIIRQS